MSKDAPNFLDFRDEWRRQMMADTRLSPAHKVVASVIADRVSFDGQEFNLRRSYIEDFTGSTRNTIKRAIRRLVEIGALSKYAPGYRAGTYKYSSKFQINIKFLCDNPKANGIDPTDVHGKPRKITWQVSDIISDNLDDTLRGQFRPLKDDASAKGVNPDIAKGANPDIAKGAIPTPIPSLSSDLQGAINKEGDTVKALAIGCAKAAPLPGHDGFNELMNLFTGKCRYPAKARKAYRKEIKSGISHEHLIACAREQGEAIRSLDEKSRPQLHRWLSEQFYDRADEKSASAVEELTYDPGLSL